MIYTQEDYDKEKKLVSERLSRNAVKRKYPAAYMEEISIVVDKFFALYYFEPNLEILNDPKVLEAFAIAETAHVGQERKYTNEDYIVHLREVASFLSSIPGNTKDEVIAGLLHDVVEKGNISIDFIEETFGTTVAQHVDFLSDKATELDGNRKERMLKNWQDFSKCPTKTNNIKAIDILSNTRSTLLCDAKYGATYLEPIVEYMNPYFQQNEHLDPLVKNIFKQMTEISQDIIKLQKKHNIDKCEKSYANQIKKLKKQNKLSI